MVNYWQGMLILQCTFSCSLQLKHIAVWFVLYNMHNLMPVMLHCLALLGPLNLWVCGVSWLLWEPKSLDKLWSRATWFLWVKRNADFAPPPCWKQCQSNPTKGTQWPPGETRAHSCINLTCLIWNITNTPEEDKNSSACSLLSLVLKDLFQMASTKGNHYNEFMALSVLLSVFPLFIHYPLISLCCHAIM